MTPDFKRRLDQGATLDEILPGVRGDPGSQRPVTRHAASTTFS